MNWLKSKPASLVEQLEYMVDCKIHTVKLITASPLELPTLCHWLATGTSSCVVCRRCWAMFEGRGEGPPHVQPILKWYAAQ